MCVSAVTRSPARTRATSDPTDSTTPVNSWPGMSGGRIRDSAQRSHSTMWRSVPQMANAVTRIRTSFGPTFGTGAVTRVRPGPGADFSIAHIVPCVTSGSFCVWTANVLLLSGSPIRAAAPVPRGPGVRNRRTRLWVRRHRNQGISRLPQAGDAAHPSLIPSRPVDNVPKGPLCFEPAPVLRELLGEGTEGSDARHVGRHPDSLRRSQRMGGREGLLAEDVEERAGGTAPLATF